MPSKKLTEEELKEREVSKTNFLTLLASMTPEEVNQLILEKGKERKLIDPLVPVITNSLKIFGRFNHNGK